MPMSGDLDIEVRNDTRYVVDEAAVAALARAVLRAEGVRAAELGVGFIGELRMRSLNRAHLGADYVTDVLAFPLEEPGEALAGRDADVTPIVIEVGLDGGGPDGEDRDEADDEEADEEAEAGDEAVAGEELLGEQTLVVPRPLGDVVVCLKRAERQADEAGLPLSLETAMLLVHGILHVLGYDHEADAGQMAVRQAEIFESLDWVGLVAPPA
jgi:rRNA maturation RNase YbeY